MIKLKYIFTGALLIICSVSLQAQQARHIHVNGEHLGDQDILLLDQLFGYTVPDAYYWLNTETGEWGYENDFETQGVLQAIVDYQVSQQQQSTQRGPAREEIYYDPDPSRSAVRGRLNGQDCTFVSSGGMTFKSCD